MVKVRCRSCGKEIEGHSHQTRACGCPNMTTVTGDSISARDMSKVMIVSHGHSANKKDSFTSQDLEWQEQRRKRKVRKLNFEVR